MTDLVVDHRESPFSRRLRHRRVQLIVVLVPGGIVLVGLLALVGLVIFAAVALIMLLLDRR